MKTIIKSTGLLLVGALMLVLPACETQKTELYGDDTGVYLEVTSYPYSFIENPDKTEDIIKIPVKVLGRMSEVDRSVNAALYTEKEDEEDEDDRMENTADPSLYEILGGTIPAGQETGFLEIRVKYGKALDDGVLQFHVHIVPSEDFPDVSYNNSRILKVEITAQEIRPANWSYIQYYFGTKWSPKWWKFIKDACNRTSIPYWPGQDPEIWWISDAEFTAINTLVVRAFKAYNQNHDEPLTHDDGTEVKLGMLNQ